MGGGGGVAWPGLGWPRFAKQMRAVDCAGHTVLLTRPGTHDAIQSSPI